MPSPPWRYIYFAGVSFRTSTSSKYRWWIWYECPILNWTNFFKTGGHVVGCREFLGCCRCVPGLADWILGYYRGDLALSWNFCETPAICRYCLPRLLPEIQLWSLPSDTLLQVTNILDNDNKEHFCSDKKNGFRNFVMSVMVELGVHKRGDPLDPDGLKAKLVFGITQLIYTIITIIPVSTKYFWWKLYFSIFMISLSRPYFSSPPTLSPAAGWSWLIVGEPGTGPAITLR